jgi:hypothetical protein
VIPFPGGGMQSSVKSNNTGNNKSASNHSSLLQENLKDFSKIFVQNMKQSFSNTTSATTTQTPFDNNKFLLLSGGHRESPNPEHFSSESHSNHPPSSSQKSLTRQPSSSLQNFMKTASYSTIKKDLKVQNLTLPQSEKERILKLLGRQPGSAQQQLQMQMQLGPQHLIKSASTASNLRMHPYSKPQGAELVNFNKQGVNHHSISGSVSPSKLRRNLSNSGSLGSAGKQQEAQIKKKNQRTMTAQSPLSFTNTRNQPSPVQGKQRNFPILSGPSKLDISSPLPNFTANVGANGVINAGVLHRVLNIFHNSLASSPTCSSSSNINKNKKQSGASSCNNSSTTTTTGAKGSQKIINNVNIVNYVNNVISSAEVLGKSGGFAAGSFAGNTAFQDIFDHNNTHNKSQERRSAEEGSQVLRSNKSAEKIYSQNPFIKHKPKGSMNNVEFSKTTREEELKYKENIARNDEIIRGAFGPSKTKKGLNGSDKKIKDGHQQARMHNSCSTSNVLSSTGNMNHLAGNSINTSGNNHSRISSNDSYRKNNKEKSKLDDHQELLNIASNALAQAHHQRQKSLPIQKNFGLHFLNTFSGPPAGMNQGTAPVNVMDNGTPKVRKSAKNGSLSFEKTYKNQVNVKVVDDQNSLVKQAIYDKLSMILLKFKFI